MKYYLFNNQNNDFIMKCSKTEFDELKKDYPMEIVHEMYDTGCDAYGNEYSYVNVSVNFL